MNKNDLLEKVAPCSLMCHTCGAYEHGVICETSNKLLKYLEGISEFYQKNDVNELIRYKNFNEELVKYSAGPCSGCRNREHHICSIKDCFILDCTKSHNVDFCGECNEFPCEKTTAIFEKEVYTQWLEGSQEIKTLGIDHFWKNNCNKPHYKAYKNSR